MCSFCRYFIPCAGKGDCRIMQDEQLLELSGSVEQIVFRNEKNEEYLKISVVSPPEKGRANKELISFAAKRLKTAKSEIALVSGEISHYKKLLIKSGGEDVRRRLQEWSREYDGRDY